MRLSLQKNSNDVFPLSAVYVHHIRWSDGEYKTDVFPVVRRSTHFQFCLLF